MRNAGKWVRRIFRRPLATGRVSRDLARELDREKDISGVQTGRTNAVARAGIAVARTASGKDRDEAGRLLNGARALVAAVGEARDAVLAQAWHLTGSATGLREIRLAEQRGRQETALGRPIDFARPLLDPRLLTAVELVFVTAEVVFWYQVFGENIEPTDPLWSLNRVGPVVLAIAIPTLGLVAARTAGPAWQRLLRHPATESAERRWQKVGAAFGAALILGAVWIVFELVSWRYTQGLSLGARRLPSTAMGWFFAVLVLADFAARAFAVSEQEGTNRRRDAAVTADEARLTGFSERVRATLVAWHQAWLALRSDVLRALDTVEQLVAAGEDLVLQARARRDDHPAEAPVVLEPEDWDADPEPHAGHAEFTVTAYRLPRGTTPKHLDLGFVQVTLHAVTAAIDVLARHRPADLWADVPLHETLAELQTRVAALQASVGGEDGGAAATDDSRTGAKDDVRTGTPDDNRVGTDDDVRTGTEDGSTGTERDGVLHLHPRTTTD